MDTSNVLPCITKVKLASRGTCLLSALTIAVICIHALCNNFPDSFQIGGSASASDESQSFSGNSSCFFSSSRVPRSHNNSSCASFTRLRQLVQQFGSTTFGTSVYASDTFHFIYTRPVGKIGGSTVKRAFLEPVLCQMFYNNKRKRVDGGCLEYLERERIFYPIYRRRWEDFSHYFTFTFVRDVCQRAISSYRYVMSVDPRTGSRRYSFSNFLDDIHQLWKFQKGNQGSYHWVPQVTGLLRSGVRRLDFVSCLKDMDYSLSEVVARINAQRPIGTPRLPQPRKIHANRKGKRLSIDDLSCGNTRCRDKIHNVSWYKVDWEIIPCGCT